MIPISYYLWLPNGLSSSKTIRTIGNMTETTTVSISKGNKERLDGVDEEAFGGSDASYNTIIGFLTTYYEDN